MKTIATVIGTLAPATAFTAENAPAGDVGIFVWIFLGFFALIIAGQLIPAAMLITRLVKRISTRTEAKTETK